MASDQCMKAHEQSMISFRSVHDQPRDQCMISHVIRVPNARWPMKGRSPGNSGSKLQKEISRFILGNLMGRPEVTTAVYN